MTSVTSVTRTCEIRGSPGQTSTEALLPRSYPVQEEAKPLGEGREDTFIPQNYESTHVAGLRMLARYNKDLKMYNTEDLETCLADGQNE